MSKGQGDAPSGTGSRGVLRPVAERARRCRLERGWTQAQVATRAGLSRTTVDRIESGRQRPSARTARALAAALGIEVDRLLGLSEQPPLFPLPDERRIDLVRLVMGLSDDEVEEAHDGLHACVRDLRRVGRRRPRRAREEPRHEPQPEPRQET